MVVSGSRRTEHSVQCPRQCAHKTLPARHNYSLSNESKVATDAGFAVGELSTTDNRATGPEAVIHCSDGCICQHHEPLPAQSAMLGCIGCV
jgi:hypothetical protein